MELRVNLNCNKGILNWSALFPFDTVKTVIQGDLSGKRIKQIDVIKRLFREGGIKAFYRGIGITVIRAFFQNGIIFNINELCHDYFTKLSKG